MIKLFKPSAILPMRSKGDQAMRLSRRQSLKTMLAAVAVQAGSSAVLAAEVAGLKRTLRLVVLDIGGTLIPDRGEVPEAMRSAFLHHGLDVSYAEIGDWRGASKRGMVRHFVDLKTNPGADREALTDAIYSDFSQQVDTAYKNVRPLPGVEKAMAEMGSDGLMLATTTGFGRELNATIFRRLGWGAQFVASINSDDVVDGRPAPFMIFRAMEAAHVESVAEVVAVGDTPLDLQAANNAGVRGAIGVTSGAATDERLRRERYTQILPSVAALPALLRAEF
jgi:phosphonatase-like hydrolase